MDVIATTATIATAAAVAIPAATAGTVFAVRTRSRRRTVADLQGQIDTAVAESKRDMESRRDAIAELQERLPFAEVRELVDLTKVVRSAGAAYGTASRAAADSRNPADWREVRDAAETMRERVWELAEHVDEGVERLRLAFRTLTDADAALVQLRQRIVGFMSAGARDLASGAAEALTSAERRRATTDVTSSDEELDAFVAMVEVAVEAADDIDEVIAQLPERVDALPAVVAQLEETAGHIDRICSMSRDPHANWVANELEGDRYLLQQAHDAAVRAGRYERGRDVDATLRAVATVEDAQRELVTLSIHADLLTADSNAAS